MLKPTSLTACCCDVYWLDGTGDQDPKALIVRRSAMPGGQDEIFSMRFTETGSSHPMGEINNAQQLVGNLHLAFDLLQLKRHPTNVSEVMRGGIL